MTENPKESRRAGRPDQVLFNPGSLQVLAHLLNERASEITAVAEKLANKFPNGSVQLGYPRAISDGLMAIISFVEELEKKIADNKVVSIITSEQLLSRPQPRGQQTTLDKYFEGAEDRRTADGLGGARTPEPTKTPPKKPKK